MKVEGHVLAGDSNFTTAVSWKGLKMDLERCFLSLACVFLLCVLQGAEEVSGKTSISVSKTLVFGPGVGKATTPLPLNYFFIQARNNKGEK